MSITIQQVLEAEAGEVKTAEIEGRREERERERNKKRKNRKRRNKKKPKKERTMEQKKVVEKWEIYDKEEEVAKSKEETKKLVSQRFHRQIHVFRKKASERMPTEKVWDHVIETKKGFVLKNGKVCLSLRKERGEMCKFIEE